MTSGSPETLLKGKILLSISKYQLYLESLWFFSSKTGFLLLYFKTLTNLLRFTTVCFSVWPRSLARRVGMFTVFLKLLSTMGTMVGTSRMKVRLRPVVMRGRYKEKNYKFSVLSGSSCHIIRLVLTNLLEANKFTWRSIYQPWFMWPAIQFISSLFK